MKRRPSLSLWVLGSCLAAGWLGCARDPASPGRAYMPDMAAPVAYEAYAPNPVLPRGRTLQPPVAGTLARGAAPLRYGPSPEEAERAGRELSNPLRGEAGELARGAHLYAVFCAVCHGEGGLGDGPIIPKYPNPPSYRSERLRAMADGRIFHTITLGTAMMPGYAAQITPGDRWRIVLHVRRLQRGAAGGEGR